MADKKIVINIKIDFSKSFDIAFLWWLAVFVVYGQQGGDLASVLVHTSTFFLCIVSLGFLVFNLNSGFRMPIHFLWYAGLIAIGIVSSRLFNDTVEIYALSKIIIRILFVSFMCAVRFKDMRAIESITKKLCWLGMMEIVLLLLCISPDGWFSAMRGARLGIGNIELNTCAFLLAVSILGCIYHIEGGRRKYIAIMILQCLVLIMFQSRTGYLAMIAGLLVYCSARYKLSEKNIRRGILVLVIAGGLGIFVLLCTNIGNRFLLRLFRYDDSIMYRTLILRNSFEIWFEKPFWGHGIGILPELMQKRVNYPWAAHNNLVGIATGMGIFGVIWYYGFILSFAIYVNACKRRKDKTIAILKSLLVVCIITDIACENYVIILTQTLLAISIEALRNYRSCDCLSGNGLKGIKA